MVLDPGRLMARVTWSTGGGSEMGNDVVKLVCSEGAAG